MSDRRAIFSTLHQITAELLRELLFAASAGPSGRVWGARVMSGGGLEKPLPEDRVRLCVRISCLAERACQRFTDEIRASPGVLARDAAVRFEKGDGALVTPG